LKRFYRGKDGITLRLKDEWRASNERETRGWGGRKGGWRGEGRIWGTGESAGSYIRRRNHYREKPPGRKGKSGCNIRKKGSAAKQNDRPAADYWNTTSPSPPINKLGRKKACPSLIGDTGEVRHTACHYRRQLYRSDQA